MASQSFNPTQTLKIIRLSTPQQIVAVNPAVELNPKRLKQWLGELPTGNVVETVELLNQAISSLNELQLGEEARLKLLEIYRSAHDSILHSYDEKRLIQLKLPPAQYNKLVKDIMWLYLKLSHGYKIIVKRCFEGVPTPTCSVLLSIFRSLEMITFGLLFAYRCKMDFPPYAAYVESHQLYAFAEQLGLLDQRIKAAKGYSKTPSIGSFYKLFCAMSVIGLNRLKTWKIEPLFYALESFAHHCRLTKAPSTGSSHYVYVINLKEDHAPVRYHSDEPVSQNQWVRFLCLDSMLHELKAWLEKHPTGGNAFLIGQELEICTEYLDLLDAGDDV